MGTWPKHIPSFIRPGSFSNRENMQYIEEIRDQWEHYILKNNLLGRKFHRVSNSVTMPTTKHAHILPKQTIWQEKTPSKKSLDHCWTGTLQTRHNIQQGYLHQQHLPISSCIFCWITSNSCLVGSWRPSKADSHQAASANRRKSGVWEEKNFGGIPKQQ